MKHKPQNYLYSCLSGTKKKILKSKRKMKSRNYVKAKYLLKIYFLTTNQNPGRKGKVVGLDIAECLTTQEYMKI